jgi:hypothetical protein
MSKNIALRRGRYVTDGWEKDTLVDVHAVCAVELKALVAVLPTTLQSQGNRANTGKIAYGR